MNSEPIEVSQRQCDLPRFGRKVTQTLVGRIPQSGRHHRGLGRFPLFCGLMVTLFIQAPLSLARELDRSAELEVPRRMTYESGDSGCIRGSGYASGPSFSYECDFLRLNASVTAGPTSTLSGNAAVFRTNDIFHPNYNQFAGFTGTTRFLETLSIRSDTKPLGTPLWLELGTQMDVEMSGGDGASRSAWGRSKISVSGYPYVNTSVAQADFGDSGWSDSTQDATGFVNTPTSLGDWDEVGLRSGRGISRDRLLVRVGDFLLLDLLFDASFSVGDPLWYQTHEWHQIRGQITVHRMIKFIYADGEEEYPDVESPAAPAMPMSEMEQLGSTILASPEPRDFYYVSGSGFVYPTSLPVPEPSTWLIFGAGLAVIAGLAHHRRNTFGPV